jgi:predicted esterase
MLHAMDLIVPHARLGSHARVLQVFVGAVFAATALDAHAATLAPDASTLRMHTDADGAVTSWLLACGYARRKQRREEAFVRDDVGAAAADPKAGDDAPGARKKKWRLWLGRGAKVSFKSVCAPKRKSAAYVFARVVVPSARDARLLVGSDDGVRVWLNGALVRERMVTRRHVHDTELVPVRLESGVNRVLLKVDQTSGGWAGSARFVDARGIPMPDLRVHLRTDEDDAADLHAKAVRRAVRSRLAVTLRHARSRARLRFRIAAGLPELALPLRLDARIQGRKATRMLDAAALAGELVAIESPVRPTRGITARLALRDATGRVLFERSFHHAMPTDLVKLSFAAEKLLSRVRAGRAPQASVDSVAYVLERGRTLLEGGDVEASHKLREPNRAKELRYVRKLLRSALADARALARGRDPYARKRQAFYRAYRSPFDGTLQPYATYVPSGYHKRRKYPLVIALHGFMSTSMITLRRALGSSIKELSYADGDRDLPRFREQRFLVAAPRGYANINYRYIAEDDVLRVIEEMQRAYNVDPDRVYLTGLSMGGLGTMEIGLHFPDRFAGLISNCGAADTRLYESVEGYTPTPWEADLIEGRSAVLWAENGLHVPFFIAHGIKDKINHHRNSRVLVREYERLGYRIESRFDPDLGHNVWDRTYEKGRIWTKFLRYKRDPYPERVVFKSAHDRYMKAYWVRLVERADFWKFARVEARIDSETNTIRASTSNLLGVAFDVSGKRLSREKPLRVELDGVTVHEGMFAAREITFVREKTNTPWRMLPAGEAPPRRPKHAGLSGPIEDFKYVRQLVVYGTQDPAEEPVLRRAALEASSYHSHAGIELTVKRDVDVTEEDLRDSHLHLFGTPRSNSLLRRIEGSLPLRVVAEGVKVGDMLHRGGDLGFKLIYPNPISPDRYVLVSAGVHAHAARWANWLPLWVPDYIVYDQRTVAPRWGKMLAGRPAIEAGTFDRDWRLPANGSSRGASLGAKQ